MADELHRSFLFRSFFLLLQLASAAEVPWGCNGKGNLPSLFSFSRQQGSKWYKCIRMTATATSYGSVDSYALAHYEVFAEREVWSPRHRFWSTFRVCRPRLPSEHDSSVSFNELAMPTYLSGFIGSHLNDTLKDLRSYREMFETEKNLPYAILLHGSTGKSSIVHAFRAELQELYLKPSWVLQIDVLKHLDQIPALIAQIHSFVSREIKSKYALPYRIVILNHLDEMSPSEQQNLKKTMDAHESTSRYILIAREKAKIIESIRNKCELHRVQPISTKDAIEVVLKFCFKQNIGYEMDGIKELFQRSNAENKKVHLREMFRLLQECFLKRHYLSAENIQIIAEAAKEPVLIPMAKSRMRCSICTLYPPCKHISETEVIASNVTHRKNLPRNPTAAICISYRNSGYCSSFDMRGRCWFAHPLNLHKLTPPTERCAQCTIPWVCNHCAFNISRQALQSALDELSKRLVRMKVLLLPDPPTNVVIPVRSRFPEYKEQLEEINEAYHRVEKQNLLKETIQLLETTRSTDKVSYERRLALLEETFPEFLHTPILLAYEHTSEL